MDVMLLVVRLFLATVFVVAGISKLFDRAGSRQTLEAFGAPTLLVSLLAVFLPLAELAIAITLLPLVTAQWAAFGAAGLLLMFSGAIGANLVRGRRPPCRCFGQLHSGRIGWPTLGRNAVLAIIASLIAWQGGDVAGPSAVGWILDLSVGEGAEIGVGLVGFALLAVEGWVLLYLLRRYGALLNRLGSDGQPGASNGLAVGTPAPAFSLPDLSEKMVSLDALRRVGKPLALVFIDLSCPHCAELLPDVGRWQRDHSADLTTVVIGSGDMQALRNASAAHGLIQMLVQEDEHLVDAYRVLGNPAAVVIHPDGTIDSPVVLGTSAIRDLIAGHLKRRSSRQTGEARDQTTGRGPGQGKTAPLLPLEF